MSLPLTDKPTSSSPIPHHHPTPLHHHHSQPKPPLTQPHHSTKPNLTTTLYHTQDSVFAVTWARALFSRSLYIHILPNTTNIATDDETTTSSNSSSSTPLFHLQIKPFIFWNKHGSKKLTLPSNQNQFVYIYYDLSRAKFGSGPEPISGFYITAIISGQIALLIGDSPKQTYPKAKSPNPNRSQITIVRREHVYGICNKKYMTKVTFRGKTRDITIDCTRIVGGDDSRLCFSVDNKKILVVKHLNWKFRGNERVEMDGVHIQISWDVYNWLFEEQKDDGGYALFMFRFEKSGFDYHEDDKYLGRLNASGTSLVGFGSAGFGFGFEKRKMKKGMSRTGAGSSSSSSLSSMSSGCGSVLEWESVEENELKGPTGFSLLVYAWKS